MCRSTGRVVQEQLVQTRHKLSQPSQHFGLSGEKDVVACPRQINETRPGNSAQKISLPPPDIGCCGGIEGVEGGALFRVFGLIPWLCLKKWIVVRVLNAHGFAVRSR